MAGEDISVLEEGANATFLTEIVLPRYGSYSVTIEANATVARTIRTVAEVPGTYTLSYSYLSFLTKGYF